jgi:hypothetical protein
MFSALAVLIMSITASYVPNQVEIHVSMGMLKIDDAVSDKAQALLLI